MPYIHAAGWLTMEPSGAFGSGRELCPGQVVGQWDGGSGKVPGQVVAVQAGGAAPSLLG